MGESTCVSCGECVQACPTGALMESSLLDEYGKKAVKPERKVDSLCPYCGVGCQLTYNIKEDKIISVDGRRDQLTKIDYVSKVGLDLIMFTTLKD